MDASLEPDPLEWRLIAPPLFPQRPPRHRPAAGQLCDHVLPSAFCSRSCFSARHSRTSSPVSCCFQR